MVVKSIAVFLEAHPERAFWEIRASKTKGLWFKKRPKTLFPDASLERHPGSMEEIVRKKDGQEVRYDGKRVAFYLLRREGNQIVILRFRAVDGSKTFVRFFSPVRSGEGRFIELMPLYRVLRNRLGALLLEKWYRKNAELAPPFRFPVHDERNTLEEGTGGLRHN